MSQTGVHDGKLAKDKKKGCWVFLRKNLKCLLCGVANT